MIQTQTNPVKRLLSDERWMKAAVAGGLWASFEIIIGSFLHNLRIPFAGSMLAAFGIVLMIAFQRLWPVRGLIWRAGLICALMKSISPSAVILGPMIGIMLEAMMLELSVRIFGKNAVGFIVGGILGVSSALLHKIGSILILYGFSLIEVYINIYSFGAKQIGIANPDPWLLVAALFGIYFLGGLLAALAGLNIPLRPYGRHIENPVKEKMDDRELFGGIQGKFSALRMMLHLLAIPLFILLILNAPPWISVSSVFVWASLIYLKYPRIYRRFRKPALWVQFLIIIVISTFFWQGECAYFICFSIEGLSQGLEMTLRAIVVIVAFSAFGIEIRNPVIRSFLEKRGLQKLYLSVSMAFSALPFMISNLPTARLMLRHPMISVGQALQNASHWLEIMGKSTFQQNKTENS